MFWSKLCKSNWNCAWNLAFPVFISPIVWNMCVNLHYESVYFKELHNEQKYNWPTIYRAGAAVVLTITSINSRLRDDMGWVRARLWWPLPVSHSGGLVSPFLCWERLWEVIFNVSSLLLIVCLVLTGNEKMFFPCFCFFFFLVFGTEARSFIFFHREVKTHR